MTAKLRQHILQEIEEGANRITYCGKIAPLQRRIKLAKSWDGATCLICIKLAEEDNPKWKHPSHRS